MQIPLLAGRFFTQDDLGKNVAIVSERAAQGCLAWPRIPSASSSVAETPTNKPFQVIGVVGDVRAIDLERAARRHGLRAPHLSLQQTGSFVIRTANDPATMSGAIRKSIWGIDAQVRRPGSPHHGNHRRRLARRAQLPASPAACLRRLRARPRRARHLRRRRLLRIAAHTRARHPHRARRAARADL